MADKNMNKMIDELSARLGVSQHQIKNAAESGNVKDILKDADPAAIGQVEEILGNPEKTKKLLESPQAQALMKLLGGE